MTSDPVRVIFFGTPDFSVPALERLIESPDYSVALVVTQPDKPAGRGGALRASPVKRVAERHGIPVLQPASLRKTLDNFLTEAKVFGPFDVGVVIAFGQILPAAVLALPKSGCVNVHASLLPRWRGAAPIHRAILAGDRETGVALMQMDEGLDTGPVYLSSTCPITAEDTTGTLHDTLAQEGAGLLARHLGEVVSGSIQSRAQSTQGVTYAEKIRPTEALIDWTQPNREILRAVRAFNPYPGAYTGFHGKRLKIFNAALKPATSDHVSANPGEITYVDRATLEVQCGSGVLSLLTVQLEGKRAMPLDEFLRGHPVSRTDIFS